MFPKDLKIIIAIVAVISAVFYWWFFTSGIEMLSHLKY